MSLEILHRYCCKDSSVTYEISEKLSKWIHGRSLDHYRFNVALLNPLLYMELRGISYDSAQAKQRLKIVKNQTYELQHQLNTLSSRGVTTTDKTVLRGLVRDFMCYKRDTSKVKAEYQEDYDPIMRVLLGDGDLSPAQLGRISTALKLGLNTKSPELKKYLYEELQLPLIYDKKSKALTTDNEALLQLQKKATNDKQRQSLDLAISIAELRTRSQMLEIHADSDGRIRCGYNIVGTETGRITCYTSPTGSGYNLQTIPDHNPLRPVGHPLHEGMRDLFVADPSHYLFQCDLSGADGWTVGAHLYSLGEHTMLDDLKAKIKPAAAIAYLLRHGNESLKGKQRDEIKDLLKEVKKDDYDYFMCKCGIWGICYLMGVDRLSDLIFTQSEGRLILSRSDVKNFRDAVFARYHPDKWHRATQDKLSKQPYPPKLVSASGHTRMFFGRFNEILGQALANEPQENTTYATNLAVFRLWHDPENRLGKKLKIEPLHQVHDALVGQFRISDTAWAITKIKSYFDNPLIIAGLPITIPFSGAYGTNWALDEKSKIGEI